MQKKYLFFLLILSFSCTKVIDISPKYFNPQPVANCIFKTEHRIDCYLAESNSILDTGINWLSNAQVDIYENGLLKENLLELEKGHYISAFYPEADKNYEIKAKTSKYEISAFNTIPELSDLLSFKYTLPAGFNSEGTPYYEADISFKDAPETTDYYEIAVYRKYSTENKKTYINQFYTNDKIILNEGDVEYQPGSLFFSDELFNGHIYNLKFKYTSGWGIDSSGYIPDSNYYLIFRSVSKEYYLYRKSWTRHRYFQNNIDQGIYTLFKGDPVEMYTNISNGYGIFAGYGETEKQLIFVPQK